MKPPSIYRDHHRDRDTRGTTIGTTHRVRPLRLTPTLTPEPMQPTPSRTLLQPMPHPMPQSTPAPRSTAVQRPTPEPMPTAETRAEPPQVLQPTPNVTGDAAADTEAAISYATADADGDADTAAGANAGAEAEPPTRQDADARDAADDAPSTLADANACRDCWRTTTLESSTRRRGQNRATGASDAANDAAADADTQPAGVESEAEAGAALEPTS